MKMVSKFSILFLSCLFLSNMYALPTVAQSTLEEEEIREKKKAKWKNFNSITGIFETKFPVEYKYKVYPFQFNEHSVAFSTEIISSLNGLKERSGEKSILIKALQTFGPELTIQDVNKLLKQEALKYEAAAKAMNGNFLSNDDFQHKGGFVGKKFYITYKHKGETYGLRIQVIMTNYAKIEQVISGPANSIYSFRSNDFLESIKPYDGRTIEKDPKKATPVGTGWISHTSRNNVFTVKLPPQNSDYVPKPPKFSASPKTESMMFFVTDPVLLKDVHYNVYAYKADRPFKLTLAKNYIFSKHIAKFVENASPSNLNVDHYINDNVNTLKTKLVITPTRRYPGISNIYIEARYIGPYLVVQEFLTSRVHSKSKLNETFFSLLDFHPKKYRPVKPSVKKAVKKKPKDGKKGAK